MPTFVTGTHDGWQHYPVASVVADETPRINERITDSLTGWVVQLDDGDQKTMAENGTAPLEHIIDLAYDGSLTEVTGLHEPYMDGSPRWEHNSEMMRRWYELGSPGSLD